MSHHDKLILSIKDSSDSFVVSMVEEDGEQEDEDVTALASQLSGLGSDCSENHESELHSSFSVSLAVVEEKLDSSEDSFSEFCEEVSKKNSEDNIAVVGGGGGDWGRGEGLEVAHVGVGLAPLVPPASMIPVHSHLSGVDAGGVGNRW